MAKLTWKQEMVFMGVAALIGLLGMGALEAFKWLMGPALMPWQQGMSTPFNPVDLFFGFAAGAAFIVVPVLVLSRAEARRFRRQVQEGNQTVRLPMSGIYVSKEELEQMPVGRKIH